MSKKIDVLLVEDSVQDSELTEIVLKNGGRDVEIHRVDTPSAFKKALTDRNWDVVISDYSLPSFDGMQALELLKQSGLDLPFILISGKVGEETAVSAVLAGAHDYVMKDNMKRLPTVVEREIRNAEIRKARREAEFALEDSEQRFRLIFENSHEGILLTDDEGKILAANQPACEILLCEIDDLVKATRQDVLTLVGPEGAFIEGRIRKGQFRGELILTRKDETKFPAEVSSVNFTDKFGNQRYSLFFRDITDRKNNEQQLKTSLKEKDILLTEIHHRVKNNLAIISGLLELQSGNVESTQIKDVLADSIYRIKAIALLHEKIYQSENLTSINIGDYLSEFIKAISEYYAKKDKLIQVDLKIPETFVSLPSAIPLGLIVNELITNAYKHAFKGRDKGKIMVELNSSSQTYILTIRDDGVGLPDDVLTGKTKKLGMTLLHGMINQLKGKLEINRNNGTAFMITVHADAIK